MYWHAARRAVRIHPVRLCPVPGRAENRGDASHAIAQPPAPDRGVAEMKGGMMGEKKGGMKGELSGRLVRLGETDRAPVALTIDRRAATALAGDSVLTAVLTQAVRLGTSAFGGTARAGFCLMGACQDCWVWTADGTRLRACTTAVAPGMDIRTEQPEGTWPSRG